MTNPPMLRVAVPNKGILSEAAIAMLKEAGYTTRRDPKDLHVVDTTNNIEFFYLRPRDIATYVGSGSLDAGFTGLDLMLDSRSKAKTVADLDFGGSTFRFAGPTGAFTEIAQLAGKRVATAYPSLVEDFLKRAGVNNVELVGLDGAVEVAVRLGVADAVADVVSTGNTLRQAGLEIFGPVICLIGFADDDDAVRIANDSEFGLSGSVYSSDVERAKRVAVRLRTGTIALNGAQWFDPESPFGGYKRSGQRAVDRR